MNLTEVILATNQEVEGVNTVENTQLHATIEGEEQTEESVLASLGINGTLFTFQLINFIVVALVLWYLILKPLTSKLEERQKRIEDSLKNAEEVDKNLKESQQKYQDKIDEAKVEANKIVKFSQSEAQKAGEQMKDKAKVEIEGLVIQAKKNITIEKQEMVQGLKKETVELVIATVEKLLEEKMDVKKDAKLIEDSIKKIV